MAKKMLQRLTLRPSPDLFPQRLQFQGGQRTVKFQIELNPLLPKTIRQQVFDTQARLFHAFFAKIGSRGLQELKNGHWKKESGEVVSASGQWSVGSDTFGVRHSAFEVRRWSGATIELFFSLTTEN